MSIEEVLRIRIEDQGLRIYRSVVHLFLVSLCRKSRTFEDISEPSKCPRVDILSFFPALFVLCITTYHLPQLPEYAPYLQEPAPPPLQPRPPPRYHWCSCPAARRCTRCGPPAQPEQNHTDVFYWRWWVVDGSYLIIRPDS